MRKRNSKQEQQCRIMDIKDLEAIIAIFEKSRIARMDLRMPDASLTLEKDSLPVPVSGADSFLSEPAEQPMQKTGRQTVSVKAALVGIFHAAPAPGAEPFVTQGQKVQAGTVVGIIEAMKTMNEITAPDSGTMAEIYVKEGDLVEFGQSLMELEDVQ